MIIVIDIGNTSIKIAVMDDFNIFKVTRTDLKQFTEELKNILGTYAGIDTVAYCSVGNFPDSYREELDTLFTYVFEVNDTIQLPFNNLYESLTLGNDRIALVAGALSLSSKKSAALVIDAGTCVTYDFVDMDKNYHGGAISPGLRLRYESLHNFTQNLPLLEPEGIKEYVGKTTKTSIHSGVVNGLTQEIKGVINQYKKQSKDLEIFITGGDSRLLIKQLKNRFFATPFLMLSGIYKLYIFNKKI